ncbi:hypothetical protein [Phocaeicola sp.]
MGIFHYLKRLRRWEEAIAPEIVQAIYNGYRAGSTTSTKWPGWVQRSYYNQGNYPFFFIPWQEGSIDYGRKWGTCEVLSNRFSGCYLACYKTKLGFYACHIHTGYRDKKHEWNEFAKSINDTSCIIFQPKSVTELSYEQNNIPRTSLLNKNIGESKYFDVWGVISPDSGECGSVLVCSTEEFIGSGYNPDNRAEVYKVQYFKGHPLLHSQILQVNGQPY